MLDDSKQAAESYDRTHRVEHELAGLETAFNAFCDETVGYVDAYLRGEQASETREAWDAEAGPREWSEAEKAEYAEALDKDFNDYWNESLSRYCQVHDQELQGGKCSACVSEEENERRNDL